MKLRSLVLVKFFQDGLEGRSLTIIDPDVDKLDRSILIDNDSRRVGNPFPFRLLLWCVQ